ncbi:MAG: peptide-methionine (S)-S-oxide reductase MsrA [Alphaproteobacteria bacterium]|nr:peptide-methionine (S)-S-oxide reductase MsrA [Alphaproteobacteria bacterium SS10]
MPLSLATPTNRQIRSIFVGVLAMLAMAIGTNQSQAAETEEIIVAGGCFWCVEKDFESVEGVVEAVSGYIGGRTENPTYRQVTGGGTGHYEAVRIIYDPTQIQPRELYDLFFRSIDPTDAGGQFCDRGESYRTAIFATGDNAAKAQAAKAAAQEELGRTIVTPILPDATFYVAEDYHQDYYKSSAIVLTRFGPITRAQAYKRYRKGCGRDARVKALWGPDAPFVN